jgi:CARDB protein/List-Bact-rpt repeat protein/matrixin
MSNSAIGPRREKKTASRVSFLSVALVLLSASVVVATTVVPISTGDLANRSDAIVRGVVLSTAVTADAEGRPETVTVIAPLEVVKGVVPGDLVLRQLGGRLPDGTFFQLWGRPEYIPGREVVVFAIARSDGGWQTAELLLGKFSVEQDEKGILFAVPEAAKPHVGVTIRRPELVDEATSEATRFDAPRALEEFLEFARNPNVAEPSAGRAPVGRLRPVVHAEFETVSPLWGSINGNRWRWTNGASAQWWLDGTANITGGGVAESQNATATWDDESNSTIGYTISGSGTNPIHLNALTSSCGWTTCLSGGGVIGCGGPRGGGNHTWRAETWSTITGGEVWLRSYCTTNGFDSITTQAVLTHELGHTLGLGHSDQDVSAHDICRGDESLAQMRSSVQHRTTLGADDADAVRWLYGDGGNSCNTTNRTLTVTKAGGGAGTVTSSPTGIDCGATCSAAFADGAAVALTAAPAAGSTFAGWSGAADCSDGSVQMTSDLTCTATFTRLADLSVSALSGPASALAGGAISISDTTANAAGVLSAGASTTGLYLSANATWEATDVVLGSRALGPLAAGASGSATTAATIPAGTASGAWYLLARADAGSSVAESDESNNVRAAAIQIGTTPPPPPAIAFVKTVGTKTANGNVSKLSLTIPAAGVAAGRSLVVVLQAGNSGSLAGVGCSDPVNGNYVPDAGAGGGDRPFVAVLSRHNVAALASGQSITCTFPKQRTGAVMVVNEFSGLSALDRAAAATGAAAGLQTSGLTATTTQANELVFGLAYAPGGFTPATSNAVEGAYSPAYAAAGTASALRPFYRIPAVPALRQYELNGTLGSSGAWSLIVVTYK